VLPVITVNEPDTTVLPIEVNEPEDMILPVNGKPPPVVRIDPDIVNEPDMVGENIVIVLFVF
jgi:hypothetical protein